MHKALRRLITVSILLISSKLVAQMSSIEAGYGFGNMLEIYPNMPELGIQSVSYLNLQFKSKDPYNPLYKSPTHGALLSYHRLGNRAVLGNGIGLQYQALFNQSIKKNWSTIQSLSMGGLYVSRPYHFISNANNNIFGSHFSALITAAAGVQFQNYQQLFSLQLAYWHSSNAHTALPNVGMNTPMILLSVKYLFDDNRFEMRDTTEAPLHLKNRWSGVAFGSWGTNEAGGTVRPTNGDSYSKYLVALGAAYRFRTIHRLSFTLEGYHDQAYALWNETMEWSGDYPGLQSSALMLLVGHEFIYGRFGLLVQGGLNLYNPTLDRLIGEVERATTSNKIKRYVPGRFALRYYLNQHETSTASCFVQAAVKSNFGQADFFELGLGFIISSRQ